MATARRCQALILKEDDGTCNHMVCQQCHTHFCWLCKKPVGDMHFFTPSGCTFYGKQQMSWGKKVRLRARHHHRRRVRARVTPGIHTQTSRQFPSGAARESTGRRPYRHRAVDAASSRRGRGHRHAGPHGGGAGLDVATPEAAHAADVRLAVPAHAKHTRATQCPGACPNARGTGEICDSVFRPTNPSPSPPPAAPHHWPHDQQLSPAVAAVAAALFVPTVLVAVYGVFPGYLIHEAEGTFDVTGVFAGMVVLSMFVIAIDWLVTLAENRLLSWRPVPGGRD